MEKQKVNLVRQKNRWGWTVLCMLLSLVVAPVLGTAAMLPLVLAAVPMVMQALLGYVGPVSAVICTGIFVGAGGTLFGTWGIVGAALLFVPVLVAAGALAERNTPFWKSAGLTAAVMFASMSLLVGLLTALLGSDLVTAYIRMTRDAFEEMGILGDSLLKMFVQMGLVEAPEGLDLSLPVVLLTPVMRREIIDSFAYIMDAMLRLQLPSQMAMGAVMTGILGQTLLRKGLLQRGVEVSYESFRTWRVPKGWGLVLVITLAVFFVAAELMPERMNSTFFVFVQMFDLLFSVQGISAFCYMLHERGKGFGWKLIAFAAGMTVLRGLALGVGAMDQCIDITRRRHTLDGDEPPFTFFGEGPDDRV